MINENKLAEYINDNVVIHGVYGDKGGEYMSYHSHGAKELINYEIEIIVALDEEMAVYIINNFIQEVYEGNLRIEFNKPLKNNIVKCKIELIKCDFMGLDDTIRIILPDKKFLFPEDEGVEEYYKRQLTFNTIEAGLNIK